MNTFSFHRRAEFLRSLQEEEFDVLIVGGGINGAGLLRDLALRSRTDCPLRLALIEREHFAHAASSKNSHLVHGGLRYLKYLDFGLVREALAERAALLRIAPHAVHPQSFLLPVYRPLDRWYYGAGLLLYDLLAGSRGLGSSCWLGARQALQEEPELNPEGLRGALLFYDGRMRPSRLVLDQLRECVESGAVAVNFIEFQEKITEAGSTRGARVRDRLGDRSFEIRSRTLAFTVGAWEATQPLRLVRGSHLILPRALGGHHALAYFERSGRILFVIPFGLGRGYTLVGTTEREQSRPEPVEMDEEEERYLRRHLRDLLPSSAGLEKTGSFAALRPLVDGGNAGSPTAVSRRHRIWKSGPNTYHIGGGKWTTFRLMAQELGDLIVRENFPETGPSRAGEIPIDGNKSETLEDLGTRIDELSGDYGVGRPTVELILDHYGRRAPEILALCRSAEMRRPLLTPPASERLPLIQAQVQWAVEQEMTGRLVDFLTLSTPLGYLHRLSPEERHKMAPHFPVE